MDRKPQTIDDYLANVSGEQRKALEALRRTIRAALPDAQECISYSMPAFRCNGHVVAGFLATKSGCSYYPFSGTTLQTLASELTTYSRTKSALHFQASRPLAPSLVRRLLNTRLAEITGKPPTNAGHGGKVTTRAAHSGNTTRRGDAAKRTRKKTRSKAKARKPANTHKPADARKPADTLKPANALNVARRRARPRAAA